MKNETNIKLFERKILKYRHRSINRKSQKLLEKIIDKLYTYIYSMDIGKDDWSINEDYKKMLHAIRSLHIYLYDGKNSNLNWEDAKIFVSYLLERIKWLKEILEKIDNN